MIRFLADENLNNEIIRGVKRRVPDAEFLRVQDTELAGHPDPMLLQWAAEQRFIVLTHDVNTMRAYFYERMAQNLPVPGLFLIPGSRQIGDVIESLELVLLVSDLTEWEGKIHYLPLK